MCVTTIVKCFQYQVAQQTFGNLHVRPEFVLICSVMPVVRGICDDGACLIRNINALILMDNSEGCYPPGHFDDHNDASGTSKTELDASNGATTISSLKLLYIRRCYRTLPFTISCH